MATRLTATSGQAYNRAATLGSQTQLSLGMWTKVSVSTATNQTFWGFGSSGSNFYCVQTNASGTTLDLFNSASTLISSTATAVGTWHYHGFSCNAANWTVVTRAHGTAAFTTTTGSNGNATTILTNLEIGRFLGNSELVNGCVAAAKIWVGVTLTAAELINESWYYHPLRAPATMFYPFLKPENVDYSGNAHTLTSNAGATTEDGPGIGWRSRIAARWVPAAVSAAAAAPQAVVVPQAAVMQAANW